MISTEWPCRLGCDQLHLVTKATQQAPPVMASTAGLEEYGALRLLLKKPDQLAPMQFAPEHRPATLIDAMDLKDSLDSLFAIDKTGRAHPPVRRG
jgi:hypothetical protein